MRGRARLVGQAAAEGLRGPVPLALGGYALLIALGLPAAADLALGAADRAVVDLGLLALRLAAVALAVAVGSPSVGPALRAGRHELWVVRGLGRPAWASTRVLGASVAALVGLAGLILTWTAVAGMLGVAPPRALAPWLGGLVLEVLLITGLAAVAGAGLRGAAGPVLTVIVVGLGHLRGAWRAAGGLSGTGAALLLVPDLDALDLHDVLLGAALPPAWDLAARAGHAVLWMAALALALGVLVRRPRG